MAVDVVRVVELLGREVDDDGRTEYKHSTLQKKLLDSWLFIGPIGAMRGCLF